MDIKPLVDPNPEVILSLYFRFLKLINFYVVSVEPDFPLSKAKHIQIDPQIFSPKNNHHVQKHVVLARRKEVSPWNCKLAQGRKSQLYLMSGSPTQ